MGAHLALATFGLLIGPVFQDEGEVADDFADPLDTQAWRGLLEQLLLTEGYER